MPDEPLSCYTESELRALGLKSVGSDVRIDRTCRLLNPGAISLGSHVRVDAYCVLSAGREGIRIGNYVHLAVGVTILGASRVSIEDFCGLSAKVSIFSSNEDYAGGTLTNPTIPAEFRNPLSAAVTLKRHSLVGAGSVILPGVRLGVGASVGALSLVNKAVPDFMIVGGNPIRRIGERDRSLLENEARFRESLKVAGEG